MFSKFAIYLLALSALAAGVISSPLASKPETSDLVARGSASFNNWGGFPSLNNFDSFYGRENFDGSHFDQVIVEQQQELVCHTEQIQIIQQRLLILQEMAKRIITEQICEVEVQTIVFEQYFSSLHGFSRDLRRLSGHHVGYDQNIASHFGRIINSDGSFNYDDFGFSGHDFGKSTVVVHGDNWDDRRSFFSVGNAFRATRDAFHSLHGFR